MSDNDATVTTQQLLMASMDGDVKLAPALKQALIQAVQRDEGPTEKLNPMAKAAVVAAFPPETEITAEMLVKGNVAGTIDLDTQLRSTLSRAIRDANPAKLGSMAQGQG